MTVGSCAQPVEGLILTTVLNTLVLFRIVGLRLAHEAGWDGFGPLIIGLAVIGVLIGALSRAHESAPSRS